MSDFRSLDIVNPIHFKIEPVYIPATALKQNGTWPQYGGGYADIWQCSMSTQVGTRRVAVKSIRVPPSPDSEALKKARIMIRREAYVWIQLSHDHILPFEGVTIVETFGPLPALVSPWMEEGTLDSYLTRKFPGMSGLRKQELVWQAASGLSYLHDKGIIHGDLTTSNILVDDFGSIRIGDFGQSVIFAELGDAMFDFDFDGNIRWMPPECVITDEDFNDARRKPTMPQDIYSYGCVMLQILSGEQPYATLQVLGVLSALIKGRAPFNNIQNHGEYGKLSELCLHRVPTKRPTIHDIITLLRVMSDVGPNVSQSKDVGQKLPAVNDFSNRSDVQYPSQQLEDVRPTLPAIVDDLPDSFDMQHSMRRLEDVRPALPVAVEDPPGHRRTTSYILRHFPSFPPYQPDVDVAPNFSLHPRRRFLSLRAPSARTVGGTTTSLYVASPPNSQTTWRREAPIRAMTPLPPSPQPSEVATTTTYLSLSPPPPSTVPPSVTISAHTPVPEQIGCCTRFLRCIQYCICCSICHKLNVYSHGHSRGH